MIITLVNIQWRTISEFQHFANVLNDTFNDIAVFDGENSSSLLVDSAGDITSIHNLTGDELLKVKHAVNCEGRRAEFNVGQRGEYVVFYNFVKATKSFGCHESVTFTAPADYTFLDNLPTLVERWKGPVSVALYAPGDDFEVTLKSIAYIRHCLPNSFDDIRDLVTFHVFFHQQHVPKQKNNRPLIDAYTDTYTCDGPAPYKNVHPKDTYRRKHDLLFPINVARNTARQSAQTHYVFAADIELYPSVNFIPKFMKMLSVHPEHVRGTRPRIYVLPIFEIGDTKHVPENKTELQAKLKTGKAQLFHKRICASCHAIPNLTQWEKQMETEDLDVFTIGKRVGKHRVWEAFYVGTKEDPLFDERYSWEGQGNKMSQGFAMCLLDYDYMILNNAFIIHKPGIKHSKEQVKSFAKEVRKSDAMLKQVTKPMLISIYGDRKGCFL